MAGCYIGRKADLGTVPEWKAQLLKNQNMLSAAHLSSGKCHEFGLHYNGNCSGKITLSKMSSNRHPRPACRLAQFHDHWEVEIKAFMWGEIKLEIDVHILPETLAWASFSHCIVWNPFKVKKKKDPPFRWEQLAWRVVLTVAVPSKGRWTGCTWVWSVSACVSV